MRSKSVILMVLLVLVSGFAVAQPGQAQDNDNASDEVGPNSTGVPDLPDAASDNARQVLSSIQDAFDAGVQGVGDVLRSLLGQGNNGPD